MRTLKHVATGMALHVLADSMKRVISIIRAPELVKGDCVSIAVVHGDHRSQERGLPASRTLQSDCAAVPQRRYRSEPLPSLVNGCASSYDL
ncbi:MAG: hypothetical protein JXQ99_27605, partial [Hyphomicrobiaceae bacterium]